MPTKPFPKTLGACVDALYKMREKRLLAQRKVDASKEEETALRDHVLQAFGKDDVEGAKGSLAMCSITRNTVADVNDWDALYEYIYKEKAFDMIQRRVNDSSYRDRLEQGVVVPGVQPFVVIGLSITKVNKK
jgi:hypothetical protein